MTRAPHPPEAAPAFDRLELWSIVSEARDLVSGLAWAIEDFSLPANPGFAITIAQVVHRNLEQASAMLDQPDAAHGGTVPAGGGRQGAKADLPGMAGSDMPAPRAAALHQAEQRPAAPVEADDEPVGAGAPKPLIEARIASSLVLCGHAVRRAKGGKVCHADPHSGRILGIAVALPEGVRAGEAVHVVRAGPAGAFVGARVRRGQLLTVDARGQLVPAEMRSGKAVHCIGLAIEDAKAGYPARVLVRAGVLLG